MTAKDKDDDQKRQTIGLKRLGMVLPREETPAPFGNDLPSSTEAGNDEILGAVRSHISTLACPCGVFYPPGAKFCSECGRKRSSEEEAAKAVSEIVAKKKETTDVLEEAKRAKEKLAKELQRNEQKKKSKKKKRKTNKDEFQNAGDRESDLDDTDDEDQQLPQYAKDEWRQRRDGGAYKNMVVDPIKGMVSNVNKGLTDADLERRFAPQQQKSGSSLMSEEEARALVKREKIKKGEAEAGSAKMRAQREAAEWAERKKFEQSRRRSRDREHLVVGRR